MNNEPQNEQLSVEKKSKGTYLDRVRFGCYHASNGSQNRDDLSGLFEHTALSRMVQERVVMCTAKLEGFSTKMKDETRQERCEGPSK